MMDMKNNRFQRGAQAMSNDYCCGDGYYRTYIENRYFRENSFIGMPPPETPLPRWEEASERIPKPFWEGHEDAVRCYWRAWQIAFANLRKPHAGSGFVADFIDPAFNGNIFLWDSVFMLMFGVFGSRAFPFQRTLDNFYAKQHPDGFICREINEETGKDLFHRFDPSGTGPNLFAWSEWNYYEFSGNLERLKRVFPVIAGYHVWLKNFRTWQDGSYYSTGWGCGMDNQLRIRGEYAQEYFHGFMSWIDTTLQQLLSARLLARMAGETGRLEDGLGFAAEARKLYELVNDRMWGNNKAFYFDKFADGSMSDLMSVSAYWALLADAVKPENLGRFVAHLRDERKFNRPHRVPTVSADSPIYRPGGDYWRGSVWAPTNYMVLRGLDHAGERKLAREIAENHFGNVLAVFNRDGTFYENYAPEYAGKGEQAASEFVGWTGVSAISVLLEYVIGVRADVPARTITWDVGLADAHGVERYPFGAKGTVSLRCERRADRTEEPRITVESDTPFSLKVLWDGGEKTMEIAP